VTKKELARFRVECPADDELGWVVTDGSSHWFFTTEHDAQAALSFCRTLAREFEGWFVRRSWNFDHENKELASLIGDIEDRVAGLMSCLYESDEAMP